MLNAKRMSDRSSLAQSLLALVIVAVLAFALGLLAGPISRQFAQTPAVRTRFAATGAPTIGTKPIAAARNETTLVRVPYEAGWELYDGGWAGGPAYKVPALVRVPYEMGWTLYDGGWAGGPPTYPLGMAGQ
jgi:hypothetical protein